MKQKEKGRPSFDDLSATRVIATTMGVIFGLSGMNHGLFEFLQGNKPTLGPFIYAIGEAQRFWTLGTEDAFTILPNFIMAGIASMVTGLAIVIWSICFIQKRHGTTIFLLLFILLFLVGGGMGQVAFFIPTWAFATRMDKPLSWWKKVLPRNSWSFLSRFWAFTLILSTLLILAGTEIAIFGYVPGMTDPEKLQNTALLLIFSAAILNIITFIAGFGHDLKRMYPKGEEKINA